MAKARAFLLLGAVALLLSLPAGAAAPASLDVEGALPLRAAGPAHLDSTEPVLLFDRVDGAAAWKLVAARAQLVEVEFWAEERTSLGKPQHSGVRTIEHDLHDVDVRVYGRTGSFTSLVWSPAGDASSVITSDAVAPDAARDAAWTTDPDLRVFQLTAPLAVSAPQPAEDDFVGTILGRPVPFVYEIPAGALHLQAADASHALAGALSGYITGATVDVRHDEGHLGLKLIGSVETRDGSVYLPDQGWTGPGTHRERIHRYVQIHAEDAAFTLDTVDAPAALFGPAFGLDLSGALGLADATGDVAFDDGATQGVQDATFSLAGAFKGDVSPGSEPGRARLTGSGDVTYVRTGDLESTFEVGGVAAAAAGVAALAGLAVLLWKLGGGALIPLFSRVAKEGILDHGMRSDIYNLVRAQPGSSPNDLVAQTGAGWSTVMYHLSVLERNELVIALKDGRYRRYFDRTSGRFSNGRKNVVSALKNPTTAAMARRIRANPGIVQRRLAEEFGLAASSVHWHIRRLEAAGLVEKRRAGQGVALHAGPGWDAIDAELREGLLEDQPSEVRDAPAPASS